MKKRYIIFLLIFLMLNFQVACKNSEVTDVNIETSSEEKKIVVEKNEDQKSKKNLDNLEVEDGMIKLFPSGDIVSNEEEGQPLYDRLIKDEAEGLISRKQRALYTIFSAHKLDDKLPSVYQNMDGWVDPQYEIKYIQDNWELYSDSEKEQLLSIILPINNPKSIYYPLEEKHSIFPVAYAAVDILVERSLKHDGQIIEIAYVIKGSWRMGDLLRSLIDRLDIEIGNAIKHGWNKFKSLMEKAPSKKVRVELIPLEKGLNGYAVDMDDYYLIRLNIVNAFDIKRVQSIAVHELFHIFQEEYDIGYTKIDEKWLCEATAVWSENYSYPKYNYEHERLPGFFKTLNKDRVGFGNFFEYQSYMLFFYLTEYADVNFIRQAIEEAGSSGNSAIRPFLNKHIPNRKEEYKKFALYNWNQDIFQKYFDQKDLPGVPNGESLTKMNLLNKDEDYQRINLNPGAIKYYHYIFDRKDVSLEHVNINFRNTFMRSKDVSRQVLIKKNGLWSIESWDNVTKKRYCSAMDDEDIIEEIVIIYSNSNFMNEMNDIDYFKVWTEGCHDGMNLKISLEYNYNVKGFSWITKGEISDKLLIKDHYIYLVKNSDYNFSGNGIIEESSITTNGHISGGVSNPEIKNTLARIILPLEDKKEGVDEIREAYSNFGIEENVPEGGVFITLPYAMADNSIKGSTTFVLPNPVGKIEIDDPIPLDGLTKVIAIEIYPNEWGPKGLTLDRSVNLNTHIPAILDIFDLTPSKAMESLNQLKSTTSGSNSLNMSKEDNEAFDKALENIPKVEGMDIPNVNRSNQSIPSMEVFDYLINALGNSSTDNSTNTLTIKVRGSYFDK